MIWVGRHTKTKIRHRPSVTTNIGNTAEMDRCTKYHKECQTLTLLAYEKALSNRKSWHNQEVSITSTLALMNPITIWNRIVWSRHTTGPSPPLSLFLEFKALENYVYSQYDTIQTYDTSAWYKCGEIKFHG